MERSPAILTECPKPYDKWFIVVVGMCALFLLYTLYVYIYGDPEAVQAADVAAVSSTAVTTTTVAFPPVTLTGGNPWTVEEDDTEEEQSGYKGLPAEIPPKGKYVPPEESTSANSVYVLTEHTNEEDTYEKPICKRLEETDTETEPVSHGLI
ncbi:MAG: hypothetical protein WCJ71_09095 [Candidatus Omnitrophota bacterium]